MINIWFVSWNGWELWWFKIDGGIIKCVMIMLFMVMCKCSKNLNWMFLGEINVGFDCLCVNVGGIECLMIC